jgi:hypothetical protein
MIGWRPAMAALVLLAVGVAGCVTRPTASVEAGELAEVTDEAAVLTFTVVAQNPGESELPLRMVEYSLSVDGTRVFRGRRSAEATLSRKNEQRIDLPVPIRWADLPEGESTYRLRGEFMYTLPGIFWRAMFDAGLYRPGADFELEGTLDPSALLADR